MQTKFGHLTYCTNIHAGESWADHFSALQANIPIIKNQVSGDKPFGIGLRLSQQAGVELAKPENLSVFKKWLKDNGAYVITMNGFPFGGFHRTKVKDLVHRPDWTELARVDYTLQLFRLLSELLPEGTEGGISTSPLSYKHWHTSQSGYDNVFVAATAKILQVVVALVQEKEKSGKSLHLDIEPEPDGLIENGPEFMAWYEKYLLPMGIAFLGKQCALSPQEAEQAIKEHVQLCYDICHFAVGYEDHASILEQLKAKGIRIGKIQVSAALKANLGAAPLERKNVLDAFRAFNETTYLHQVVALQEGGGLIRYPDLPEALRDGDNATVREWRSHFHVPLFTEDYGAVQSTASDIRQVLSLHKKHRVTECLEIETYTWEVLPEALKCPIAESIVRELQWTMGQLG